MAKTDFTIADVLAWARTKPADGTYTYTDIDNCALCQFLRETGRAVHPVVGPFDWDDDATDARNVAIPAGVNFVVQGIGHYTNPDRTTFGALAARLEKLVQETPLPQSEWARLDAYMHDIELASA